MNEQPKRILLGRRETGLPTNELTVIFFGRNLRYVFDLNEPTHRYIHDCIVHDTFYEKHSALALYEHLNPGDTFIDVGAHCGVFSVLASALVEDTGHVISIEPNASNCESYRRHEKPNMQLWQAAAGAEIGSADIFVNADNDGGHCFWDPALHWHNTQSKYERRKETVRIMPLDYFADSKPAAIKIDTEGYEPLVLRGAKKILNSPELRLIICEQNLLALGFLGMTVDDLTGPIEAAGFVEKSKFEGFEDTNNLIYTRP